MALRYEIDELLWLRSSPLVIRPSSLPPIEEWMGPIPDPRKTSNARDPNNPNETTPRRPSFFESRHITRGSNSDDIILGPPKTAFASASRIAGKGSVDLTERPSRQNETDESKNDRFNFRNKFFKDREPGERDFDRRDSKPGTFNGRREEKEDWNSGRPRRTFGQDEQQDRKPRRNGEFDRWDRDQRDQTFERGLKDKDGRFPVRKDAPPGRARHEGSWFRDENTQEGPEHEEEKNPVRNREWRRDRHGADRDWTRGAKLEQEPEWLDANDKDESRRVRTQEDFERWKERMKAGSSQTQEEEKKEAVVEPVTSTSHQVETSRPTDGELFSGTGTPFQPDTTMERFFGLLGDAKPSQEVNIPTPTPLDSTVKKESVSAKSMKSSRFAGLFSPPPGSPARDTDLQIEAKPSTPNPHADPHANPHANPHVNPHANPHVNAHVNPHTDHHTDHHTDPHATNPHAISTDADQQGFQRILQMLGGGGSKSRNATPHNDTVQPNVQPNRPPLVQAEAALNALSSPSRESMKRPEYMAMQDIPARAAGLPLQENFHAQESFSDSQARDREHLLRLMQQVRVSPVANQPQGNQGQPPSAGPAHGMMNLPEMLPHPPGIPTAQKGPHFLDDPAIANMQRPDPDQLRRRPANGPPMGYFDDVPFPQAGQVPITPGGSRAPQGQGHPAMSIPRPPGFEHLPPPGWNGPQMPPQQGGGPSPMAPPPGIPTPTRGVNPNFMMPMHGNVPPLNERQLFPRGSGPPPGMMPPPGYMNGPPPNGFPPMPPNGDALMGLGHRGPVPFEGNPGPPVPPPSSRHLLDMFGQVGGPGQFR